MAGEEGRIGLRTFIINYFRKKKLRLVYPNCKKERSSTQPIIK